MVAYAPATHPSVVATSTNPKDNLRVDGRIALLKQLQASGVADVQFGNTTPGDNTKLWWHTSASAAKRYNPLTGAWVALTESQFALWLHRRLVSAAGSETTFEASDLFAFHDASAGEAKVINGENLRAGLRGGWQQYGATVTLESAASQVEFDLPPAYRDFLLKGAWTATGSGSKNSPILTGVYANAATVDFDTDFSGSVFTAGVAQTTRWYGSGDRGDLTGFLRRIDMFTSLTDDVVHSVADKVTKIRYRRPNSDSSWQFAIGAQFALFVR